MKHRMLLVVLALLLCATVVVAQEPVYDHLVFFPWVAGGVRSIPTPTITPMPVICDCSVNLKNCSDFATQAEAQQCYNWCMLQGQGDVHNLDVDSDGIACENLTEMPTSTPTPTPSTVVLPTVTPSPDRVALLADTQNANFTMQQQVIASLAARDNDFLVLAGDVIHLCGCNTDTQCADARYQEQFAALEPLRGTEWHFSPGNHDYCVKSEPKEFGIAMWKKWVGARYHTYNTHYACFFMLDDQVWDAEQAQWLDEAITQCDKPWKILVKHFPIPHSVETSGYRSYDQYTSQDVDLVVAGHRHNIVVWQASEVFNILLPAGSYTIMRPMFPYPVIGDEVITPLPVPGVGFGELEIGPTTLTWRVFRFDGVLLLEGDVK